MNKIIFSFVLVLFIFPTFAQTVWQNISLEEALKVSKKENKPVFIDCYTKTCGPCKYYKKEVFPLEEIGEYMNKNFICIMQDMEENAGPAIGKKYNIMIYPTFLVLDADGNELYRVPMLFEPHKELIPTLKLCQELGKFRSKFRNGDRSPQLLRNYFESLKAINCMEYEKELSEYLVTEKKDSLLNQFYWNIIKNDIHNIESPLFRYTFENRKKYAEICGQEEVFNKLFKEYENEFRMARMMGLNYDIRIHDMKILQKDGVKEATELLWRMPIYDMWNSAKGQKGDITKYLKKLNKIIDTFSPAIQLEFVKDFAVLSEITIPEEEKILIDIIDKLMDNPQNKEYIKRMQELKNFILR